MKKILLAIMAVSATCAIAAPTEAQKQAMQQCMQQAGQDQAAKKACMEQAKAAKQGGAATSGQ